MAIYSHSRLSTFENCPLQYKFNYIDRIKRAGKGIEAFIGEVPQGLSKVSEFMGLSHNLAIK